MDVFCREYHAYKHASDVLARSTDVAYRRKLNAAKLITRKARVLGELADRLGLTPQARFKLGLVSARTEAVRVQPRRTPERAREIAAILRDNHALPPAEPPADAEVVEPTQ